MKKVWKWMLGILIGLVVIAVVLGAGYIVARGAGTVRWKRESRLAQRGNVEQGAPWQTKPRQRMPGQNNPGQNGPGQNGLSQNEPWNFGRNGMPMYYSGGMGFHPFGGMMLVGRLVGGVFQLALLGLVIFLAVTLALRQKQFKQPVTTVTAQAAMLACPHCAGEVQADWKHCPYCGNSLEPGEPDVPLT